MTEIEIETLAILKDHCGVMNSEQALLSTIEQEAIIAVYEKDKQNIQAVSKTKVATTRRDLFLTYALLLEKEENSTKAQVKEPNIPKPDIRSAEYKAPDLRKSSTEKHYVYRFPTDNTNLR